MDERYKHIDITNEKVNRIINCAFEEFANSKFEKASTNNIVKKANVSRGLLYHYFKDKKDLYNFLVTFSMDTVAKSISKRIDWNESDILNRLRQSMIIKQEVVMRYPYLMDFYINSVDKQTLTDSKKKVRGFHPELRNKFYNHNVDYSMFRDGIDINMALNVIHWTLEKLGEEVLKRTKNKDYQFNITEVTKEFDDYIKLLRTSFYK